MLRIIVLLCLAFPATLLAKDFKVVGQEFMPLEGSGPDGKMAGVHYEIVKQVCKQAGITCTTEIMPLARGLEEIKTGEAQMILGVAINPERAEIATFPKTLTQVGYTFFVKKGQASKYKSVEDFKGKTVGVHDGSATHKNLMEQNKKVGGTMKIETEATAETAPKKLAGDRYGEGAAIYCARAVCAYQAKKENLAIEPVKFDGFLQGHSVGISKKGVSEEEAEKIKKAFADVMKKPEIKKLILSNDLLVHPDYK
jgi:polar amino acid transport system substrate-binding protein